MKHQFVRFFTILTLLTLLFGAVPVSPAGAEAHAVPLVASGDFLWAKSAGGTGYEYPNSIAADLNGNVYTVGSFEGTADFDPGPGVAELTSAGSYEIFMLKLDSNGNHAWAKRIGGIGSDFVTDIVVDANDDIYITGHFASTAVDFDPGAGTANLTSAGGYDIFVAKYDSDGNYLWAKRMGGSSRDNSLGMTIDANGNIYTTGNYQSTADFDPGTGTANLTSAGNEDVFVSKLDNNGNFVWAKSMGGTDENQGRGIAVSAGGNVFTIGDFRGVADFDPGAGTTNLTSAGEIDVFISKLDSSGNFVWAKRIGGTDYEEGTAIALDTEENIYTTGKYVLTVDFNPGAGTFNLTSAGQDDTFVSKLDSNGNFVWARSMGGAEFDRGESIVLDTNNNVYMIGVFVGTADFDPGAGNFNLVGPNGDAFISILNQNGGFITAKHMGGTSYDSGNAITLDAQDNILTTGFFSETGDFDPGPGTVNLTSAGDGDVFISKLEKVVVPTSATFGDVPMNHPYWLDIEILYANGFTGGCSSSPLLFCPETTMDRAQGAVFMLRGLVGTSYVPPVEPFANPFGDSWSQGPWAQRWAQGMLDEGLTAGCSTSPLLYCPWEQMPRAQAAVFGMRLLNGSAYLPPAGTGTVFADINGSEWYAGWAEQAYLNGLLPACGMQGSTPLFCPNSLVSRGLGAYMIVRARNLSMP